MPAFSAIVERLLNERGITGEARERFFASGCRNLPRPGELPHATEAAARILDVLASGGKIVVFGDYDTDGVCAAAILMRTFRWIRSEWQAQSAAVLPDRFAEGYGLTMAVAERILAEHPDVKQVVTVDNGITSAAEIAWLKSKGVDVIVTDHHLPGEVMPDALTVNPHIASCRFCENLCGSGVAYYIAWALMEVAAKRGFEVRKGLSGELLVLAGLATVADIVPLTDANRDIVREGLRLFTRCAPAGLRELHTRAMRRAGDVTTRDFSHVLSPRLNAAGRLKKADIAYELLMEDDPESVRLKAKEIDELTVERRQIEAEINASANVQIAKRPGRAAYHVYGEGWHKGVLGIVAGRLSDRYGVPVAVSNCDIGSIRAPDGINIREALDDCRDLFVRYGGHATACGFQLKPGMSERFDDAFADACAKRMVDAPKLSAGDADMEIAPGDVTPELWHELQALQPFGEGNPEPVFALPSVALKDASPMGEEKRHLSIVLDTNPSLRGVWWGHGHAAYALSSAKSERRRVTATVALNRYGEAELTIRSISR